MSDNLSRWKLELRVFFNVFRLLLVLMVFNYVNDAAASAAAADDNDDDSKKKALMTMMWFG